MRKTIERMSHDPPSVVTTYEGNHNHEAPAAPARGSVALSGASAQGAAGGSFVVPAPDGLFHEPTGGSRRTPPTRQGR